MRMSLSAGGDYTPLARSFPSQSVADKGLTGAVFPPAASPGVTRRWRAAGCDPRSGCPRDLGVTSTGCCLFNVSESCVRFSDSLS